MSKPVTILMIEDDQGHARLIERNIRRAGVRNEILHFSDGASAFAYLKEIEESACRRHSHTGSAGPQFARCLRHRYP